ncbi:MAG: efflux RND transporter periplasmic adaptor subunit [Brasilonema angustatum HA4187-MV1]|jgi:multidrug efflux pump subunit AcrA (membrane-fusion protein)|nr:efflux RND transporter periplasmic adaptor subunit [Brasilonema angustatum HA4187-MV1]
MSQKPLIGKMIGVSFSVTAAVVLFVGIKINKSHIPQAIKVQRSEVQAATVEDISEYVASVKSRRSGILQPRIQGQITRIFVRAGDTVAQGDAIIQVESVKQQKQIQYDKITAPFAGTVDDIPVKEGELVNTSSKLTTIVQNQPLEVNILVPTERAPQLRKGMSVEIMDVQGRSLLGITKIFFISPSVNNNTQSILIKALFDNSKGELRTGQFTRARVIWAASRSGVLIPARAVVNESGKTYVYVPQTQQSPQGGLQLVAQKKRVKLGNIKGSNYQVFGGLQSGERIIVSELLSLQDGTSIIPDPIRH